MPCIVLFCETRITSKTHITSDMCSRSRCKGVEISLGLCKNITRDMCFHVGKTHFTRNMSHVTYHCHVTVTCVPPVIYEFPLTHSPSGMCIPQPGTIPTHMCCSTEGTHITMSYPLPGKHRSLVICVPPPRKHISLVICVAPPGKHISLVICVTLPEKHK